MWCRPCGRRFFMKFIGRYSPTSRQRKNRLPQTMLGIVYLPHSTGVRSLDDWLYLAAAVIVMELVLQSTYTIARYVGGM